MKILKEQNCTIKEAEGNVKLNFKSYGFERWPEEDFSDDGNKFYMYRYKGELPMSYCRFRGDAYISLRADYMGLNYEEYSKLPSYKLADKYNGFPASHVDLKDLASIAEKYLSEIKDLKSNIKPVSSEDWESHARIHRDFHTDLYSKAKQLIMDNFDTFIELSDFRQKSIKDYLKTLKNKVTYWTDSYKSTDLSSPYIRKEIQNKETGNTEDNWYYKQIKELLGGK